MVLIIIGIWMAFLAILVKVKVFKGWALWMKLSPLLIYIIYFLIIAVPMNFMAPKGMAVVYRNSVQISPAVAGMVTDIPARSGKEILEGDVLFSIDQGPYQAAVDDLKSQLELAKLRLDQARKLAEDQAGSVYDVQQFDAQVRQLEAQLEAAQWNLEHTTVRAPAKGIIPNIALTPGTQVSPTRPVMTLIHTDEVAMGAQIKQNYVRHIEPGLKAEIALKLYPGKVFQAEVLRILPAAPSGQLNPSGIAMDAANIGEKSFVVELKLPEDSGLENLPAGAFGTVCVYAEGAGVGGFIRAILLRVETWVNFL